MTLLRPRRRTRQFLVIALILSALIHLVGGGLWGLFARVLARVTPHPVFMASLQETPAPNAEIIRIERRPAAARPAHEDRAPTVAPRPHPRPTIAPAPPRPRHEIARLRIHAAPEPPAARAKSLAVQLPRHPQPVAAVPVPDNKPAISDRKLAQLGQDFSKTIADSRETLAGAQAESEHAQVVTIKHYGGVAFSGIHEGMNPGDGEIFAISQQRVGNTMWYYTRYTYMHGDGTYESDEIPWPFHYPLGDDPFARHDKRIPLQAPPPGYKPDRPLKPILQQFFGGPPVTD